MRASWAQAGAKPEMRCPGKERLGVEVSPVAAPGPEARSAQAGRVAPAQGALGRASTPAAHGHGLACLEHLALHTRSREQGPAQGTMRMWAQQAQRRPVVAATRGGQGLGLEGLPPAGERPRPPPGVTCSGGACGLFAGVSPALTHAEFVVAGSALPLGGPAVVEWGLCTGPMWLERPAQSLQVEGHLPAPWGCGAGPGCRQMPGPEPGPEGAFGVAPSPLPATLSHEQLPVEPAGLS